MRTRTALRAWTEVTMMHFAIELLAWLAISAVIMSFAEHQIHRHLMHNSNFLSRRFQPFKQTVESHAVLHHGHYRAIFSDEPVPPGQDRGLRLSLKEGFLEALPVACLIATISLPGAIILVMVVCLHHFFWNIIHVEMHKPEQRFFSSWPLYKWLARHHYLHHRYPNSNFNVVLPLADYVLGTNSRASKADLKAMYQLGFLSLRPAQSRLLLETLSDRP